MTKVHRKDVKKIPMTEKVCQLYEEEQLGKTREVQKSSSSQQDARVRMGYSGNIGNPRQ